MVAGRRRVVITGIGCVTPLGLGVEPLWKNLMAGASGVGLTTVFDASRFPTKISAEVRNWDISDEGQDASRWRFCGRHTKFAAGAALQAMKDAGLPHGLPADPTRLGVYLGSGEGQQDFDSFTRMMNAAITGDVLDVAKFTKEGLETLHPLAEVEQEPNMPAGHLAGLFDAQGPNLNCLTACAASSQAIGEAAEIVRRGEADVMLSGGTHSMIHPFGVTGFNLLTALSTRNDEPARASRPFDNERDGFVLGEGAAMVVLEELEHAKRPGAHIHGELIGYGWSVTGQLEWDAPQSASYLCASTIDVYHKLCQAYEADLAQIAQLAAHGGRFELHYATRDPALCAYGDELAARHGGRVHLYYDDAGQMIDLPSLLAGQPLGTHLYVCGPKGMIAWVRATAEKAGWPRGAVHHEEFLAPPPGKVFDVTLAASGKTVTVGTHQSLLEAIEAAGVEAPYLCRGGACGQCETDVLACDGTIRHNDHWLTEAQKASGQKIMPCVSRFEGHSLVLNR